MKKFSFVIITYNYKDYLVNCLESLNKQLGFSPDEYEVVIVDDGSNDGTYECIQKMNLTYSLEYIYINRTEKSCRNAARNRGWKIAKGETIVFLDADMIINNSYLKNLNMCYEVNSDIAVVGMRFMLDEPVHPCEVSDGSIFSKININKPEMKYYEDRHYYFNKLSYNPSSYTNMWLYFYTCNVSIPKKYLKLVGGFNENIRGWGFDDQELGYRLTKAGVKLVLNHKLEGLHQYHGEVYGTLRSTDKVLEQYKNVAIIYRTYKDLNKVIPKLKVIVYSSLKMHTRLNKKVVKSSKKHLIHVENSSSLEKIKNSIKDLANIQGNEIIVHDHLENSDLHIWVQFLGETKGSVKYFPVSRILDKKSIKNHMKYLKKKYPNNRLVWLMKIFFLAFIKQPFIKLLRH